MELLSFRAYARSRGLAHSTIVRQVQQKKIPVVKVGRRRLLDPHQADAARRQNLLHLWDGKRGEYAERPEPEHPRGRGYHPRAAAILNVLLAYGPDLMRRLMLHAGASEAEAFRVVWAYREWVGCVACCAQDERWTFLDYRTELAPFGEPDWPDTPELAAARERCDQAEDKLWNDDSDLCDDLMAVARRARI